MKNIKIATLIALMLNAAAFAQVGINTSNPQGIFNIDGAKDNPTTGSGHTAAQQANDVTVLANGRTGIGTISPTQKLHIEGNTRMNGMIYDGINAAGVNGQVLSNDGSKVRWVNNLTLTPTVLGSFDGTTVGMPVLRTYYYTGASIVLPPGNWIVTTGTVARLNETITVDGMLWVKTHISNSNTTYSQSPQLVTSAARSGAGPIGRGASYGMVTGNFIIKNNTGAAQTYYIWGYTQDAGDATTARVNTIFSGNSHERWLYATPIVQ